MSSTLRLQIPSNPKFLSIVRAVVEDAAKTVGFKETEGAELKLAVDEAMTNIIRHSLKGDYCRTIEVVLVLEEKKRLEVILTDDGEPASDPCFQPASEPSPCRIGGVGVYLMCRCMDNVRYQRLSDDRNRLSLVKHLK